jgi:hypothetical protein
VKAVINMRAARPRVEMLGRKTLWSLGAPKEMTLRLLWGVFRVRKMGRRWHRGNPNNNEAGSEYLCLRSSSMAHLAHTWRDEAGKSGPSSRLI